MLLREHQQAHKQPELMCYMCNYAKKQELCPNTNRVTSRYNCSSVFGSIITTMNGKSLKMTGIVVCKCHYLRVTKILIAIKIVEKNKKKQEESASVL